MEPITRFSMGLVLSHVLYVLKNKPTEFTETSGIYLNDAHNFFQEIVENLNEIGESRNRPSSEPVYNFVPNMKEIINIRTSTGPSFKDEQLQETRAFFVSIVEMLYGIIQNPRVTYKRIDYGNMLSFFNSATALFQKNPMLSTTGCELQQSVVV